MLKKLAVGLGILALAGIVGGLAFNSSRISIICRILANCESFKAPYDTALILNRDAKSSLANSVNIYDLRRVYKLAEKSSKAVSVAEIPNNYAEANTLNNSNKELLDKVGDRINQEEKAEIYLKQAQDKAGEASTLAVASMVRANERTRRRAEETAQLLSNVEAEQQLFRLRQLDPNSSVLSLLPETYLSTSPKISDNDEETEKIEERKQQIVEYRQALISYKESLELVKSIPPNSFVDEKKTILLKEYTDKINSTEMYINSYLAPTGQ